MELDSMDLYRMFFIIKYTHTYYDQRVRSNFKNQRCIHFLERPFWMNKELKWYRFSSARTNFKSTMGSHKAGDKYALCRYYFDILISPLLEILFEWRGGRDGELSWYCINLTALIDVYRQD